MSIFSFSNYRVYIRHHLEKMPRKGRGQVMRMAEHLRVNSTLVSQVLSGQKDFTLEQALEVAEYFAFSPLESEAFLALVQKERAGTAKLKAHFQEKFTALKNESLQISKRVQPDRTLTDTERSIFYSSWLYAAVWLFTSLGDEGKTLEETCAHFDLPRTRAADILRFLTETGLCTQKDLHYKMGAQSTHVEQGSPFLLKHHSNWRLKAIDRSETLSERELLFTAPLSISKKDFDALREELAAFIKKVYAVAKDSPAETIACMNLDFFFVEP